MYSLASTCSRGFQDSSFTIRIILSFLCVKTKELISQDASSTPESSNESLPVMRIFSTVTLHTLGVLNGITMNGENLLHHFVSLFGFCSSLCLRFWLKYHWRLNF